MLNIKWLISKWSVQIAIPVPTGWLKTAGRVASTHDTYRSNGGPATRLRMDQSPCQGFIGIGTKLDYIMA